MKQNYVTVTMYFLDTLQLKLRKKKKKKFLRNTSEIFFFIVHHRQKEAMITVIN